MKKMYKKPITENLDVQAGSVICTSPGMNDDPIDGTDADHRVMGDAPARRLL